MSEPSSDSSTREQYHNWGEYARSLTDLNWDGQTQSESDVVSDSYTHVPHNVQYLVGSTNITEISVQQNVLEQVLPTFWYVSYANIPYYGILNKHTKKYVSVVSLIRHLKKKSTGRGEHAATGIQIISVYFQISVALKWIWLYNRCHD